MGIFSKILGDPNLRELNRLQPIVEKINSLEEEFEKLSDTRLSEKTFEFKERLQKGENLDDLLPEAFAAVREASKRTLGQRHFDVQLLGGIVLHQGKIAEMKTGEGKTLVATLASYLNALEGKGVHIVTVNDYLAKRDTQWMGSIYDLLGISVGCIQHEKAYKFKKEGPIELYGESNLVEVPRGQAYLCDITYGTNNEFGFDYLRDNMTWSLSDCVQREANFAILDEIDSILIDEARTPLIISAPAEEARSLYYRFAQMARSLAKDRDYKVDEKDRSVLINEEGISKVERHLGVSNIYEEGKVEYVHHLENALKAKELFHRDKDYVVKDGEIIIVDEFTGRLMFGRRYSEGIHQAIEAKEGVEIKKESQTLATITFQNYFRLYSKLAGMTGTAATEAEEFHKIYNLDVVIIPTNRPLIRTEFEDQIYKTEEEKFQAVIEEIKRRNEKGQPVLVGTVSIEKNEHLASLLERRGIRAEVLNAKNHEREAAIIAQAGKLGAITVATNMAGRGVDIILGGSLSPEPSKEEINKWQKEHEEVCRLGGLHIIGTERHEARRIDNQLRGRSGRQGDPGSSQFFVSLEDDLMRLFGGEKVQNLMERLGLPEGQPITHPMITKALENAQKKVEGHNFDLRKHLLEYDDVLNKQREAIYRRRKEILAQDNLKEETQEMIASEIRRMVDFYTQGEIENWDLSPIANLLGPTPEIVKNIENQLAQIKDKKELGEYCQTLAHNLYKEKEKELGTPRMRFVEKALLLRIIDNLWISHLDAIEELRTGIGLRGYAQKDPLVEFKHEAYNLFQRLLSSIATNFTSMIYKVEVAKEEAKERPLTVTHGAERPQAQVVKKQKIGRNDPCPCGATDPKTGKPIKYKKCHGK